MLMTTGLSVGFTTLELLSSTLVLIKRLRADERAESFRSFSTELAHLRGNISRCNME
jgi:hypothetical protein